MSRPHVEQNAEALGGPTDSEITAITKGMPDIETQRFKLAATALLILKARFDERTPWMELVNLSRQSKPGWVQIEATDDAGNPVTYEAYLERGVEKLKGKAHVLTHALRELSDALAEIEDFNPARHVNKEVRSHVMKSWPKKPPSPRFDTQEILDCLNEAIRKHSMKKIMMNSVSWIVDRVMYEWEASHNMGAKCPSANTIRPVIEAALPQHPKIMKKSCKKAVS